MSTENVQALSNVFKEYLNNIVYIDDEFKVAWSTEDNIPVSKPKRSTRHVVHNDKDEESNTPNEKLSKDSMEAFCIYVQKHFPQILLCPIKYSNTPEETLIGHLKKGKLIILDWSLKQGYTAVNLIQAAKINNRLKLFVIYTSNILDAKTNFIKELSPKNDFTSNTYKSLPYEYIILNSCVYMFCEKSKFSFEKIIDAYTELFFKEYGYFPVAFIELITRLEDNTSLYLNKFSRPFDSLLLLQTNSDQLSIDKINQELNQMVLNNIKQDISLNNDILKGIYDYQIDSLLAILNGDDFNHKLDEAINNFFAKITPHKGIDQDTLKLIEKETFKNIIRKALSNKDNLYKSIEKASDKLSKECSKIMVKNFCSQNGVNFEALDNNIIKELTDSRESEITKEIRTLFPYFLILLERPNIDLNLNNLIMSLKILQYDPSIHKLSDILVSCYTENNGTLDLISENALENKLYSGDVLFMENEKSEITNCLLCIVPACHMLRPKKVNSIIQFVHGEIMEEYPKDKVKDSEHITMLPNPQKDDEILCVKWKYHDIVSINLKNIDSKLLESYKRPYRLMDEYIRQIMGEFTSFYSKVGVEELFIKSSKTLADLFL